MSRIGDFRDDDVAGWIRLSPSLGKFSDELLADLTISCAMWLGMGRMLRTLNIGQACRLTLPSRA